MSIHSFIRIRMSTEIEVSRPENQETLILYGTAVKYSHTTSNQTRLLPRYTYIIIHSISKHE